VYYGEKLSGKAAFCQLKRLDRKYGSLSFVEKVKSELGFKAAHREVIEGAAHMRFESTVKLMGPILAIKMRC
jgi:hypothetical protein